MARLPEGKPVGPLAEYLEQLRGGESITDFAAKCGVSQTDMTKYRQGALPLPATMKRMKATAFLAPHARELDRRAKARASQQREEAQRRAEESLPDLLPSLETEDERTTLRLLLQMIDGSPWLLDPLFVAAKALRKAKEG